jgi:hypothetical protein
MHRKGQLTQWEWQEGRVDRAAPHLKLFYGHRGKSALPGHWGKSALPVALVAKPVGNTFAAEFLPIPELGQGEYERIKLAVTKELTFYLVEKGEPDPWNYAIYHCGTASKRLLGRALGLPPRWLGMKTVSINRAPVLTLWAAVVARRLGFTEDEALSLGRAVAGLDAQAKGRRLGLCKPHEEEATKTREKERGERFWVEVLGRPVPATHTDDGIRAVQKGKPVDPDSVRRYLEDKFGEDLKAVRSAMEKLAKASQPRELAHDAYRLYGRFRPAVPEGVKGWGARGDLDLGLIERRAKAKP